MHGFDSPPTAIVNGPSSENNVSANVSLEICMLDPHAMSVIKINLKATRKCELLGHQINMSSAKL